MSIDRLQAAIQAKSFVCVGLDPRLEWLPTEGTVSERLFDFNRQIIDATYDLAACFKLQIAFYEAHGLAGLKAYHQTIQYAKERDCLVIGDIKRGDIDSTAQAYAQAHFSGDFEVDWVTLNPYMGYDTIMPYLPYLQDHQKGIFVLVRTSNPGAKDIEYQWVDGQPLYLKVADDLAKLAQDYLGESGASNIGFVLGGTQVEDISALRQRYQQIPFLIPGYGAQGADPRAVRDYLGNQGHSIVNASRSIIYAFRDYPDGEERMGYYARQALEQMIATIERA